MQSAPEELNETEESFPRTSERLNFFLSTIVSSDPHGKLKARVRNLSAGGIMIEFAEEPEPGLERGHRVAVELRNIGRVKGEVAWVGGRRLGIKFDRDVDPELARKPIMVGEGTPDFVKPILVPSRSLRYVEGLKGR